MDEIEKVALLPCPFCGGNAYIGTVRYSKPPEDTSWADGSPVTEAFYGHCCRCGAGHRNSIVGGYQTPAEAIAAWNRRALDAVPSETPDERQADGWLAGAVRAAEATLETPDERQAAIVDALRANAEDLGAAGYNHWLASDEMHKSDCRATGEHTALHAADWIESGEWRRT